MVDPSRDDDHAVAREQLEVDAVALRLRAGERDRAGLSGRVELRAGADRRRRVRERHQAVRLRHVSGPRISIAARIATPPTTITISSQAGVPPPPPPPPPPALGSGGGLIPASLATASGGRVRDPVRAGVDLDLLDDGLLGRGRMLEVVDAEPVRHRGDQRALVQEAQLGAEEVGVVLRLSPELEDAAKVVAGRDQRDLDLVALVPRLVDDLLQRGAFAGETLSPKKGR